MSRLFKETFHENGMPMVSKRDKIDEHLWGKTSVDEEEEVKIDRTGQLSCDSDIFNNITSFEDGCRLLMEREQNIMKDDIFYKNNCSEIKRTTTVPKSENKNEETEDEEEEEDEVDEEDEDEEEEEEENEGDYTENEGDDDDYIDEGDDEDDEDNFEDSVKKLFISDQIEDEDDSFQESTDCNFED